MKSQALAWVLTLPLLLACGRTETGIHVVIEGPAAPGSDFDLLEILAASESGEHLGVESFSGETLPRSLPFRINFVSARLPTGTPVHLEVKASSAGALRWQARGTGTFETGQGGAVTLTLHSARLENRLSCSDDSQCLSGHCAQGVCCASACAGPCERCDTPASEGKCVPRAAMSAALSCEAFLCDGRSGSCPSRCAGDEACVAGAVCLEGSCRVRKPLGGSCALSAECMAGTCIDGVCCRQACTGACARCMPGTGECGVAPAGVPGTPSCAPFACNGASPLCPSTCSEHAHCAAPNFGCREGQCVPRVQSFKDDFSDGQLGPAWAELYLGGGTSAEQGGTLRLISTAGMAGAVQLSTPDTYDGREASVQVEVKDPGNQSLKSVALLFGIHRELSDFVGWTLWQGNLLATKQLRPSKSGETLASVPLNLAAMRFLRLSESGGTLRWEYSADGVAFLTLTTAPAPIDVSSVGVFAAFVWESEASASTAILDNVNTP